MTHFGAHDDGAVAMAACLYRARVLREHKRCWLCERKREKCESLQLRSARHTNVCAFVRRRRIGNSLIEFYLNNNSAYIGEKELAKKNENEKI